jgi:hypothetical protein
VIGNNLLHPNKADTQHKAEETSLPQSHPESLPGHRVTRRKSGLDNDPAWGNEDSVHASDDENGVAES